MATVFFIICYPIISLTTENISDSVNIVLVNYNSGSGEVVVTSVPKIFNFNVRQN